MSMTWQDVTGNGNWELVDNSYDQPRTPDTVTSNIVSQRQAVDTSGSGDAWSSWFQKTASAVLGYAVQKDAAQSQMSMRAQQAQPTLQPLYANTGAGFAVNPMVLMMVVGIVVLAVVVKK